MVRETDSVRKKQVPSPQIGDYTIEYTNVYYSLPNRSNLFWSLTQCPPGDVVVILIAISEHMYKLLIKFLSTSYEIGFR